MVILDFCIGPIISAINFLFSRQAITNCFVTPMGYHLLDSIPMSKSSPTSPKVIGRALLIGRRVAADDADALAELGLQVELSADPYAAMAELTSRPLVYRALVLPLPELFPEELVLARVVKTRYPHLQIIATDVPDRANRADELRQLGIEAILSDGRLHPIESASKSEVAPSSTEKPTPEPVLTAEELRALLGDESLSARRRVE
jgi:hypothetical protein